MLLPHTLQSDLVIQTFLHPYGLRKKYAYNLPWPTRQSLLYVINDLRYAQPSNIAVVPLRDIQGCCDHGAHDPTGYLLRIESLTFGFGPGHTLVKDMTLALRGGEIAALIGPSGVGKSTFLRVLTGQHARGEGEIQWLKHDRLGSGQLPNIALLSQTFPLFEELSVEQNVGISHLPLFGRLHQSTLKSVRQALAELGLDESYMSRRPHSLSGGEAQRVAIARTLSSGCPLMLFDEPFSNLDKENKLRAVKSIMRRICDEGGIGIVVLHDDFDALQIADVMVILHPDRQPVVRDLRAHTDLVGIARSNGFATPGGLQTLSSVAGDTFHLLATDQISRTPAKDEATAIPAKIARIADLPQGSFLRLETSAKDVIWVLVPLADESRCLALGETVFIPDMSSKTIGEAW